MVFPGPSLRARRIAPATLTPDERPRLRPSSLSSANATARLSEIGDEERFVDLQALEVRGDAALADAFGDRAALGLELAGRVVTVERGARHVGERDDDVFAPLAQSSRNSGQSPAGADRADEAVDLAVGLLPDLRGQWCAHGCRGWRHCRTGWRRSRLAGARAPAARPCARRLSRNCWGCGTAPPALRRPSRRASAACPSSPGSASPG